MLLLLRCTYLVRRPCLMVCLKTCLHVVNLRENVRRKGWLLAAARGRQGPSCAPNARN